MRKEVSLLVLLLIFSIAFVLAEENSTIQDYSQKIEKGFSCLEEKAGVGCLNLEGVSEISLTILAGPSNIFSGCVEKLKQKTSNPDTLESKELAQALLALKHANEDTTILEEELMNRSQSSTSVDWILNGINSQEETISCTIKHGDSKRYEFDVSSKGRISVKASTSNCFRLDYNDFRIKIESRCYGEELTMSCGGEFKIPLFYKESNGDVHFVLKETQEGMANEEIKFSVNSLCITNKQRRCDYEATLWGAYALRKVTGESIKDYMPFIVTSLEKYPSYFPEAFIPLLDPNLELIYSERILEKQKTDGSWHLSNYGDQYDTALAILSYGIQEGTTDKSERWLYTKQKDDGCWRDSATTAMVLWSLTQKAAPTGNTGSSLLDCELDGEYYCLPSDLCDTSDIANELYVCSGVRTCCTTLKTCNEWEGISCEEGKICSSATVKSSDEEKCCLTTCVIPPSDELSLCEEADLRNFCSSSTRASDKNYIYEEQSATLSASCGEGRICYKKVERGNN